MQDFVRITLPVQPKGTWSLGRCFDKCNTVRQKGNFFQVMSNFSFLFDVLIRTFFSHIWNGTSIIKIDEGRQILQKKTYPNFYCVLIIYLRKPTPLICPQYSCVVWQVWNEQWVKFEFILLWNVTILSEFNGQFTNIANNIRSHLPLYLQNLKKPLLSWQLRVDPVEKHVSSMFTETFLIYVIIFPMKNQEESKI